jgi:hypothetical protein
MFAIAAGYEDGDDCDSLRHDAIFKMAVGHAPESGPRRNSNQAKINREPPRRHLATQSRPRACQAKVVPSTRNYAILGE